MGDRWFRLLEGFDWRESANDPPIEVRADKLGNTDLASIPFFLRWFAAGYGRHTAAALLHDQLRRTAETPMVTRARSDRIFLIAMRSLGVPLVRRLIMSTAVVAAGRALARQTPNENNPGLAWTRSLLTWVWLAGLILVWLWTAGGVDYQLPGQISEIAAPRSLEAILIAALAAPMILGLLWDSEYGAGVVAGWAVPVFLPFGMMGVALTFVVYGVVEFLLQVIITASRFVWYSIRWLGSRLGFGSPPPRPSPVPGPTPWGGARIRLFRTRA